MVVLRSLCYSYYLYYLSSSYTRIKYLYHFSYLRITSLIYLQYPSSVVYYFVLYFHFIILIFVFYSNCRKGTEKDANAVEKRQSYVRNSHQKSSKEESTGRWTPRIAIESRARILFSCSWATRCSSRVRVRVRTLCCPEKQNEVQIAFQGARFFHRNHAV